MAATRKLFGYVVSLLLIVALIAVWLQRQAIFDWWRLRNYQPSSSIRQLADNTTMTSYATKLFYVHYPELDDKATFSGRCQDDEQTLVLGCYIQNRGIYIFDVQDARLNGVKEVTAAHETLHAAYDRLDTTKRQQIDAQLQNFFATLTNERIKQTIEQYRSKDPGVVPNELHSIIGTEVRDLPPELETYYRQYFNKRQQIVAYSEQYEKVFSDRKNKVAEYDKQLSSLKQQIESAEAQLQNASANLDAERQRLNRLLAENRNEEYNAAVPGFNAQVRQYNVMLRRGQDLIKQYNQVVTDRNAVALEERQLLQSIDSRMQSQQ